MQSCFTCSRGTPIPENPQLPRDLGWDSWAKLFILKFNVTQKTTKLSFCYKNAASPSWPEPQDVTVCQSGSSKAP